MSPLPHLHAACIALNGAFACFSAAGQFWPGALVNLMGLPLILVLLLNLERVEDR